ncbi:DNA-binding MarR family transcriptional regulator [Chelatococcus asaccharovorans]|uniref:DNA-binding MarR family transcriptional regulator n=1 Tax=Chelatococcus asaccharovorans TaxID=28210 RepID=A0A2V3TUC3_9HYPH|nr:winged helix-turn-helix transcriptional regulator [Chelatococcus asaccharovorans]PXW52216.1 DNA-binding MarR family transcriptional regulator [Chelatococcus asaccharovorans]
MSSPTSRGPLSSADAPSAKVASAVSPHDETEPLTLTLSRFIPYRLNVLAQVVAEGLGRIYEKRFGFGLPEWRTIALLGELGEMTARDIGAHTRMHKTKVSRATAALEDRGLVERRANERDRREAFLSLTPEGRALYTEIIPLAISYAEQLIKDIPAEELAAFDRVIELLMQRSGIPVDAPPEMDM